MELFDRLLFGSVDDRWSGRSLLSLLLLSLSLSLSLLLSWDLAELETGWSLSFSFSFSLSLVELECPASLFEVEETDKLSWLVLPLIEPLLSLFRST
jgi:hypothetical protein